jgi:hypothetical protein
MTRNVAWSRWWGQNLREQVDQFIAAYRTANPAK